MCIKFSIFLDFWTGPLICLSHQYKYSGNAFKNFVSIKVTLQIEACHHEAAKAISEEYERMILCLYLIMTDDSSDSKTTSQAKALLQNIVDYEFLFGIKVLRMILIHTAKLSSYFAVSIRK